MCGCEDGDMPKVFERVLRKARRDHRCCECCKPIGDGSWHEEVNGLWGDSWDTFRTCTGCVARRMAWNVVECHPVYGHMRQAIVECLVTNDYDRCIGKMRRHVDRQTGRSYMRELKSSRVSLRAEIQDLERARAQRYRRANCGRVRRSEVAP